MTKLTKENKERINKYILDCIDTSGYIVYENRINDSEKDKLQFVFNTFKAELGHEIKQKGLNKAFASWLSGLPSAFNIDFENNKIIGLAEDWGQPTKTDTQVYNILNTWFDFITIKTFQLMKHYKVNMDA
jgi:hypothetical protein